MPAHSHRYLLVDGHSVIFAWPELRGVHEANPAQARELLCRRLRTYQDQTGERVVVVFDGKGAKAASGRENPDDIQIIYAPASRTADSIIERLAAQYGETYPLTVATADRLEQMTVFSFGALCIDPAQLLDRVLRAESALAAAVKALRHRR